MTDQRKKPVVLDWEGAADPTFAPAIPEAGLPQGSAMQAAGRIAARRGSALSRLTLWVFLTLGAFVLSVAAWDFVTTLLSRDSVLGWIAFGLVGAAVTLALVMALREASAYFRLGRLSTLRTTVEAARTRGDLTSARSAAASLGALYAARPDLAWGRARLADRRGDIFDADALLSLVETELLGPLDQAARAEIEAAARQVATVTALVPLALADVAMALYANLRMIRRLAEIYGGRSVALGSWGLLRRVFTYLLATGAVAIGDDLVGSFAGGGLLSKLSRRFGEGVINGALTARVGLAAMELCRPMPFVALPRPKVTNLVRRGLTGLFGQNATTED
jgi:putative membrane protein